MQEDAFVDDRLFEGLTVLTSVQKSDLVEHHYLFGPLEAEWGDIVQNEERSIVFQGSTGLRTWSSGILLANFILRRRDLFSGKRIIEISAGLGLSALVAASLLDIENASGDVHVLATEVMPVLPRLEHAITKSVWRAARCSDWVLKLHGRSPSAPSRDGTA